MSKTNQITIATYDKTAELYRDTSPQIVSEDLKKWFNVALDKMPKNSKIFEIGSGTGKDAEYIESLGYKVECTDASKSFVKILRSKRLHARLFNVLKDEIVNRYDLILADAVLLHFNEVETKIVLTKVLKSLKNKGMFLFTLKIGEGEEITDRKLHSDRYFKYWSKKEITQLLKKVGFKHIIIDSINDYRAGERPDWLFVTAERGLK